jgi:hypothetical protein
VAAYRFLTTWLLDSPVEPVFDAIHDSAAWPDWWEGVRRAELLEEGGEDGVGRLWDFTWRSRLPYDLSFRLRVTRVERPWRLEGDADGELIGRGCWRLYHGGAPGTAVVYEWDVSTSRAWMNRLAPVARPAFAWNHDAVMRQGGQGLARRLGVPLIAQS